MSTNDTQDETIIFEAGGDEEAQAKQAIDDPTILSALIEALSGSDRRTRQFSAAAIREVSREKPELLFDHVDELRDALYRPEAQTRWEMLETLEQIADVNPDLVSPALDDVEEQLYDEDSGTVRLTAFSFLARYGSKSPENSDEVWFMLDDGIQCYHGDPEFASMLNWLKIFAGGDISDTARTKLLKSLEFDALSGRGYIKKEARNVISIASDSEDVEGVLKQLPKDDEE